MGFADGFYYGQGKIIVDTTNLLATDVVRVRSMTTPTKVWNKTVTTPGDYMVFEVPGKDYYKISLVREVEEEGETIEAEINNINKTMGYGEVSVINVLDKASLRGIQAILDSHSENDVLNIGDEVTITVNGSPWVMQVGGIDLYADHEVILVSKYLTEGKYATG